MSFSKKFCILFSLAKRYFLLKTNLKMNKIRCSIHYQIISVWCNLCSRFEIHWKSTLVHIQLLYKRLLYQERGIRQPRSIMNLTTRYWEEAYTTTPAHPEDCQIDWILSMIFTFLTLPWIAYVTMSLMYYSWLRKKVPCLSTLGNTFTMFQTFIYAF